MSKLLTEQNFKDTANNLNIEVAVIKAVAEVESAGEGFLQDGRPKILFEAHIFSGYTKHIYDISHPNISSKKWNKNLYKGGTKEYDRLYEAIALNKNYALLSASWGKFQICGFNYKLCGWNSIEIFVDDMYKSELEHLKAFCGFISSRNLIKYLRDRDWVEFAKRYNGEKYYLNNYDVKLKEAYEKYSKIVIIEIPENKESITETTSSLSSTTGSFYGHGASGNY